MLCRPSLTGVRVLALGPPQSPMSGFQTGGTSNFTSYRGFEDYFPEEEIRMRSHEMLENEDMPSPSVRRVEKGSSIQSNWPASSSTEETATE
ncbi:Calmodulin-binding protein 60 B [Camellia lanceoleosa]|nr:Calmodulin-binding protein 60 B [Camellia lanceoleosa]